MLKKTLFLVLALAVFFTVNPVLAVSYVADESSQIRVEGIDSDYRVTRLRAYLQSQNSPLAPYAGDFVRTADKYGLDWRLVPAISGVESTFGKRIPGGYNAYGWAGGDYRFTSWENSIEVVSKSLREDYIDKGAGTISKIGRRYCPPSTTWAGNVKFFMEKIEPLPLPFTLEG